MSEEIEGTQDIPFI